MALKTDELKNAIKSAYSSAQTMQDKEEASDFLAEQIANAIEAFIKSGEVIFESGEIVGTCPSGGGPLTLGAGTGGEII